jgi:hypothetical protein
VWQHGRERGSLAGQHFMVRALRLRLMALVAWRVEADRRALRRIRQDK